MFYAVIETKQNGKNIKEKSQNFKTLLQAEMWLHSCCDEARKLKIKVKDHYLCNVN